ncbi:MAG TPA: urea carboxylase-associated family protein [Bacillota bacterium]|nr:urea carboxylase-associated family protein [Bacillota bacterium]
MDTAKLGFIIPAQEGRAFALPKGRKVRVIDPKGKQVADFLAFNAVEPREFLSTGATIDNNGSLYIKVGQHLYSNLYRPMLRVTADTVGAHDLLHPPCSPAMYRCQYGITGPHPSCHENFKKALAEYGLDESCIWTPFNIFMNTRVHEDGRLEIKEPLSRAGDYIELEAMFDLIVAVTACSVEESSCNAGRCGPIKIEIY